jgi:transcriptional regulator of acetoin/glycerol metabolism
MRSEKSIEAQKKEALDGFNLEEGLEKEAGKGPSFAFFPEKIQERDEIFNGLASSFPDDSQERKGLFQKYQSDDRLFSLFVEYFFLNSNIPLKELIDGLERNIILRTLHKVNGHQKKAAKILKIKYSTLNLKIKKYNIHFKINPF